MSKKIMVPLLGAIDMMAAESIDVTEWQLRNWIRRHKLPGERNGAGGRIYVDIDDVRRLAQRKPLQSEAS